MGEQWLQNLTERYSFSSSCSCGVVVKVRRQFAWVKEPLEHWRESPITRHVWGVSGAWHELVGKIRPQCRWALVGREPRQNINTEQWMLFLPLNLLIPPLAFEHYW